MDSAEAAPSDTADDDLLEGVEQIVDVTVDEVPPVEKPTLEKKVTPIDTDTGDVQRSRLMTELLALSAGSCRGEAAREADIGQARLLVEQLEALCPITQPTLAPMCKGTWELVFSDTQLFRSSPFFMAGRAVCADGDEARRYDWFCEMHRAALAISTIGKVRQVVSSDSITSEFEVSAGAVPFLSDALPALAYSGGLPFAIRGSIVSTASIESNLGDSWRLLMDTVEIKGSNIPLLRQALDAGVKLGTRELGTLLEDVVPTYANPRPLFRTSYLDDTVRISRDQDGKIFVYKKVSDETTPCDYGSEPADLGLGALLTGIASQLF